MNGFTYELTDEQRARNEFNMVLSLLEAKPCAYWFNRLVAAWEALKPYATPTEWLVCLFALLDFAAVDPAHSRYGDPRAGYETPMETRQVGV